jgi:hypothetical protein
MTGTSDTSNTQESSCSKDQKQTRPTPNASPTRTQPPSEGRKVQSLASVDASAPQHLQALKSGNEKRFRVAGLKKSLMAGSITISEILQHPDIQGYKLFEVLTWQRRWGQERAQKLIDELNAFNPTVGNLTPRQHDIIKRHTQAR